MSYGHFGYSNRPDPIEDPFLTVRSTSKQINYMMILFNDLGADTSHKRLAWTSEICQRKIESLDLLTKNEASQVITQLKEWKEEKKKC